MQKILDFIKEKYSLFLPILLFTYLVSEIIGVASYIGPGAGAVLTTIFLYLIWVGITFLFTYLFLKKKEEIISFLVMIMLVVFGYRSIFSFATAFQGVGGIAIATVYSIFSALLMGAAAFVFVLYLVRKFREVPADLARSGKYVALGIIPFAFLVGILYIVVLANYNGYWANYFSTIGYHFAFIPLLAMTYIVSFHQDPIAVTVQSEPKEEPTPEPEPKPTEEAPVEWDENVVQDDKPSEEPEAELPPEEEPEKED